MKDIRKITNFANSIGWEVEFGYNLVDECIFEECKITICTRFSKLNQLYSLIHELGHVLIQPKLEKMVGYKRYERWGFVSNKRKTNEYKMMVLQEEFMAWERAEKIAKIFGIKLGKQYRKLKTECLKAYVDSASSLGEIH